MALFLILLVFARPTNAHGYIVRAIPEDRAVLERAPTRVQYWFSEDLEPQFSRIELLDQTGNMIAAGEVDAEDNSLMVLRPPADLPGGAYVVSLRPAFASDGHVVAETRVFFVGENIGGVEGSGASDMPVPLEVVWRGIVLTSTTLLLGVFVLYDRVLLPAWGSKKHTAGFLPPRVMTRLTWIAVFAFVVAIVGNILALLQNAMVLFDAPLSRVIGSNLWNTARISSRFGEVWNIRMLLLLILAALMALTIYWRNEKPRTVAPFWRALMWGTALVTATFAVSSHAAGAIVMPWVAMLMHWLHMTAVAVWTGGLAALALVLPTALQPYDGEQKRLALLAAMRKFSPLALGAAAVTITSGVYNALMWLFEPADMGTTYGVHLVYKVLLVGGLLLVGAVHHVAANPERYARWQNIVNRVGGWRVTLPLETVAAFAVLLAAGYVSATPVPTPDFVNAEVPVPRAQSSADNLSAQMTISPGGLGVNTYDVQALTLNASAINERHVCRPYNDTSVQNVGTRKTASDDATGRQECRPYSIAWQTVEAVYVQMVRPTDDRRGVWHAAEAVEDGLFVAAGDELDEEGYWLSLVDVQNADGTFTRLVYEWDITDDASVIESISPRWQHWAALAAVTLALGYVVYPAYTAFMQRMNLNALTVSVIVLAVVGTGATITLTTVYIQNVQQQTVQVLNPPPQVVNSVLPDESSLQTGDILYNDHCAWEDDERVFAALIERLPRTRDEELFTFTAEGWRSLPPCDALLSDDERWHIVNYVRTFAVRGV